MGGPDLAALMSHSGHRVDMELLLASTVSFFWRSRDRAQSVSLFLRRNSSRFGPRD